MRNTPIPSYDHYASQARQRRGKYLFPPPIIQDPKVTQEKKRKRGRRSSRTSSEGLNPEQRYDVASLPFSFYAVIFPLLSFSYHPRMMLRDDQH